MLTFILFFLGISIPNSGTTTVVYSTAEVLEMAEENRLPEQFQMSYIDRRGKSSLLAWDKQPYLSDIPVYILHKGIVSREPTPLNAHVTSYRGRIIGTSGPCLAQLNSYDNQTRIFISTPGLGNVFIGKKKNQAIQYGGEVDYITQRMERTACTPVPADPQGIQLRGSGDHTCKKIYLSITADYDLYLQFGRNKTKVQNYIYNLISTVQDIYRLEEIQLGISEVIIHTSEDGLRHISAYDDLSVFRYIRRTFNGNIALCLSGFKNASGFAPLGGHAFLSSLCIRSTSYAYVNVDGGFTAFPNYSWDIFSTAHELGHVLGSEHTHACVWGPNQDQTLDNCSPPEGGCTTGPPVTAGTIMSYCHLPGNPGINFSLGFGQEPGDRIRSKIASATCLSDFLPSEYPPRVSTTVSANTECFDGTFTHYFYDNHTSSESDDVLILSIDKKGQNIGHVYDGTLLVSSTYASGVGNGRGIQITAPYVGTQRFFVTHKYYQIRPSRQPSTPVRLKLAYHSTDIEDLDHSVAQPLTTDQLSPFVIKAPGEVNPSRNHRNTNSARIQFYRSGTRATTSTFTQSQNGKWAYFEYETNALEGFGLGAYENLALPVELIAFKAERKTEEVHLFWTVANETALMGYQVEYSVDGRLFRPIDFIPAEDSNEKYGTIHENPANEITFYRLIMKDLDGTSQSSPTVSVEGLSEEDKSPWLQQTLIRDGIISLHPHPTKSSVSTRVFTASGRLILEETILPDQTKIELPFSPASGVYYIQFFEDQKSVYCGKILLYTN